MKCRALALAMGLIASAGSASASEVDRLKQYLAVPPSADNALNVDACINKTM